MSYIKMTNVSVRRVTVIFLNTPLHGVVNYLNNKLNISKSNRFFY
jgi:hypothetical protein